MIRNLKGIWLKFKYGEVEKLPRFISYHRSRPNYKFNPITPRSLEVLLNVLNGVCGGLNQLVDEGEESFEVLLCSNILAVEQAGGFTDCRCCLGNYTAQEFEGVLNMHLLLKPSSNILQEKGSCELVRIDHVQPCRPWIMWVRLLLSSNRKTYLSAEEEYIRGLGADILDELSSAGWALWHLLCHLAKSHQILSGDFSHLFLDACRDELYN